MNKTLISEIYGPVLQGEGPVAGRATIFVRTFGCDSRCLQCDSMFSVDPEHPDAKYKQMTPAEITMAVDNLSQDLPVTFSGGNPVIWDLNETIHILQSHGHKVWVETQGTYWRDWLIQCDGVVVSPKGPFMDDRKFGNTPLVRLQDFYDKVYPRLSFKVVIGSAADLDYAEKITTRFPDVPMYLSVGCPIIGTAGDEDTSTALMLLHRYGCLGEMLVSNPPRWPRLRRCAAFIPQLHVLTYGHERGK